MKILRITPLPNEVTGSEIKRECKIERIDEGKPVASDHLWFKFPDSVEPPNTLDCDSYIIAMLFEAMLEGRDIEVCGCASKQLLSNLHEYQHAWCRWLPDIYSPIKFVSVEVDDSLDKSTGAVCAFSGGLDACFSVWRHTKKKCGFRSQEITFCSQVHGFDIPIEQSAAFLSAKKRSESTLNSLGIELVPIATNYREIAKANWLHAHAAAIVAVMSNFKKHAGTCIVGSTDPYDYLVIPWGSSPITDHLLGGQNFEIIHDGATHSRTNKIADIAEWGLGVENLRVCWQGEEKDRNCGRCEKCLRTKLNFLVNGLPIPNCLPQTEDLQKDIKKIKLTSDLTRSEWKQIYDEAKRKGIREDWVNYLPNIFKKPKRSILRKIFDLTFPNGSNRRNLLRVQIGRFRNRN